METHEPTHDFREKNPVDKESEQARSDSPVPHEELDTASSCVCVLCTRLLPTWLQGLKKTTLLDKPSCSLTNYHMKPPTQTLQVCCALYTAHV